MRVRGYIAVAAAGLILAVMGTAGAVAAPAPVPVDKPGAWMQVTTETKLSGDQAALEAGRPALRIRFTAPKGPISEELWMVEGNVVYELRAGHPQTMDDLLKRLGSGL